jgi:hypothetical protein
MINWMEFKDFEDFCEKMHMDYKQALLFLFKEGEKRGLFLR